MWHAGERAVQERAGVTEIADRLLGTQEPVVPPIAREFLSEQPWIVLGAADARGRMWASPRYGEPGFITTPDEQTVQIAARPLPGDPLTEIDGRRRRARARARDAPADAAQRARDADGTQRHHDRARAGLLELPEVHRDAARDAGGPGRPEAPCGHRARRRRATAARGRRHGLRRHPRSRGHRRLAPRREARVPERRAKDGRAGPTSRATRSSTRSATSWSTPRAG